MAITHTTGYLAPNSMDMHPQAIDLGWDSWVFRKGQANEFTLKITPLNSSGRAVNVRLTNKTGLSSMKKDLSMTVLETFASDSMRRKELLHHPPPPTHIKRTFKH
jgi:hypothetical protein